MGIDIIHLGGETRSFDPAIKIEDLGSPAFQMFRLPNQPMVIWMMTNPLNKTPFPWWPYEVTIDDDLRDLNQTWRVTNPQNLFDILFLTHLQKQMMGNMFVIFPGNLKTVGWTSLREVDQDTYKRGQGCVYHLNSAYDGKMSVNWVPFWAPQSIVRNPPFGSLWRLFANSVGDEETRCLTFLGLSNPQFLPEIVNLLIEKDDERSEKLSVLVDWFGVYSSPFSPRNASSFIVYTRNQDVLKKLGKFQEEFLALSRQIQTELLIDPHPRSVLRILTRLVAL
ncbi:MAG: hypothetical protein LHV69_03350 [Elusimicrobia bacterium]|nr:hypothetical protein [Candidatus Obscuribacterium magneticum]